jgi:hypothetical protein
MDRDTFVVELNELLSPFGGSYSRPSGWQEDGLAFSCVHPPIIVPFPEKLSDAQRATVIRGLAAQLKR